MKQVKKITAIILCICMLVAFVGCGQKDEYDTFEPVGVTVVESYGDSHLETNIDDEELTQKMWNVFDTLTLDLNQRGEMGSAYIYMCFYNEDQSTLGIFTIYENGVCCLGEDFSTFYVVNDGEDIYMEIYNLLTSYSPK